MAREQTANLARFVLEQLPEHFLRNMIAEDYAEYRIRVFPFAVTIWLMMCQRFGRGESLASAVERLRNGECEHFLDDDRERIGTRISRGTGGYCQARQRLPLSVVQGAADHLNRCVQALHEDQTWDGRHVYLVDGSSLALPHSEELKIAYPPCTNQHGESHWPMIRTCCLHDLTTGVALRPAYGPIYGEQATGEGALFLSMLERLPEKSVIVGDRLYGSFRIIFESMRHGHDSVVRLSSDRARAFLKHLRKPGELPVNNWQTSYENRKKRLSDLPENATITGRFIWHRLRRKGYRTQDLYLFTTMTNPAEEIVELYGRRWSIEDDIRTIKCIMNLEEISAKTPLMVEKELVLAFTAYNLVRHIAAIAAREAGVDPRRISFTRVLNFITFSGPRMVNLPLSEQAAMLDQFVDDVPQILNRARKRPPEPRKVVARRRKYPPMTEPRAIERKTLTKQLKKPN